MNRATMRCFSIKKRIPVFKTSEQKLQLLHSVDGSEFRPTVWDIGIPDVNHGISTTYLNWCLQDFWLPSTRSLTFPTMTISSSHPTEARLNREGLKQKLAELQVMDGDSTGG